MATYLRGKFLRYRFRFAGKQIDESTKTTSKTIAREAERQHRRALEAGYKNFKELRENRVRVLQEIIDEYLVGYRLRYRSATFAEYALGHVARLLGTKLVGDIMDSSVLHYQEDRLRENAAPKSINEEVRFLLKMLGEPETSAQENGGASPSVRSPSMASSARLPPTTWVHSRSRRCCFRRSSLSPAHASSPSPVA